MIKTHLVEIFPLFALSNGDQAFLLMGVEIKNPQI